MKFLPTLLTTAIALFMPEMAIAQRYEGAGNQVSNLGNVTATSSREATKLCGAKGGNILVHLSDKTYSCHFAQGLVQR